MGTGRRSGYVCPDAQRGVYQLELRANYSLGSVFHTSPTDHFSLANPLDVNLNLGWLWPLNKPKQVKFEN